MIFKWRYRHVDLLVIVPGQEAAPEFGIYGILRRAAGSGGATTNSICRHGDTLLMYMLRNNGACHRLTHYFDDDNQYSDEVLDEDAAD